MPAEVRGVLLRAEGKSFSAGLDRRIFTPEGIPGEPAFGDLAALDAAVLDHRIAEYQAGFTWLRRPDLVTVAAVQGHAVGAGFQLALACDLMVVASDTQLCIREPSLGLVPDLTGTQPLVDKVGYSRALEICLTGRWISAAEAVSLGLASTEVPPEGLDGAARALLECLVQAPAPAAAATKALLQGAGSRPSDQQWAAERAAQGDLLRSWFGNNEAVRPR